MIEINEKSKIYVLCPAYSKTGGPELLHQLVYKLINFGYDANITYYDTTQNKNYTPDEFKQYVDKYSLIEDVIDSEDNLIIFPEIILEKVLRFKRIRTALWWLSIDNYFKTYDFFYSIKYHGLFLTFKRLLKGYFIKGKYIHKFNYNLCQSYYAIDFLKRKGIKNYLYLSDYINNEFFSKKKRKKEDIVLYNPRKGYEFTKKIINASPELNWVPIKNLTTIQVSELLSKSKVYVDFGNHPGKDRFPREACISGCCVITGKRGSANFYEDVMIENEFKFQDSKKNIPKIIKKIHSCIKNYSEETKKFEKYRENIKNEENQFDNDIKNIFIKKS